MSIRTIPLELQAEAEKISNEWDNTAFIYLIPDSSDPDLLRLDVYNNYKYIERTHMVASVNGYGWQTHDDNYALEVK